MYDKKRAVLRVQCLDSLLLQGAVAREQRPGEPEAPERTTQGTRGQRDGDLSMRSGVFLGGRNRCCLFGAVHWGPHWTNTPTSRATAGV